MSLPRCSKVYINTAEVNIGTVYLGVPVRRYVSMVNLSNLEVNETITRIRETFAICLHLSVRLYTGLWVLP